MYIYIFRLMIVDEENENKEKRLIFVPGRTKH